MLQASTIGIPSSTSTAGLGSMKALLPRLPLRSRRSVFCNAFHFIASPRALHAAATVPPHLSTLPCFQSISSLLQNLSKSLGDHKSLSAVDSALAGAQPLDITASVLLLRALAESKKLTRAKSVLCHLKRSGAVPDLFLYSLLLQCILPESSIRDVELVWHEIVAGCTGPIFSAADFVVRLCRRREDASDIEQVYRRISRSRWRLSREGYMALIGALCGRRCPNPSLAIAVLREMEEKGFEADELTYFALFRSFCRVGNVSEADSVLRIMAQRWNCKLDMLIYGNFVFALCKSDKLREARKLYGKMTKRAQSNKDRSTPVLKSGRRAISQLSFTGPASERMAFGAYIRSLCRMGRVEQAEKLFREAKEKRIPVQACVYGSFIESLFVAGRTEDAIKFWETLRNIGNSSSGDCMVALIVGLSKLDRVDDAYKLLIEMVNEGLVPTAKVSNCVLESYWRTGRTEEAIGLFEGTKAGNFGGCVRPDASTYSLMIRGLLGRGDIGTALSLLEQMEEEKLEADVGLHMSVARYLYTSEKFAETQKYLNEMVENGSIVTYAEWEIFFDFVATRVRDDNLQ